MSSAQQQQAQQQEHQEEDDTCVPSNAEQQQHSWEEASAHLARPPDDSPIPRVKSLWRGEDRGVFTGTCVRALLPRGGWAMLPHGRGGVTFENGDEIRAGFVRGKRYGSGAFRHSFDGSFFVGQYVEDIMQGPGVFVDGLTNEAFTGDWCDGKPVDEGLRQRVAAHAKRKAAFENDPANAIQPAAVLLACEEAAEPLAPHVSSMVNTAAAPPRDPVRVCIADATGGNAAKINGIYNPTGEMYNGRPLFQKQGDGDKWLRYVTSESLNDWRVSSTSHKDANDDIGWLQCGEKGLEDPTQATSWKVYHSTDKRWDLQPSVTVVAYSSRATGPVHIFGVKGGNAAKINGIYNPTGEMYNGRPLFQKQGDGDKWLRYVTSESLNDWRVSSTSHKDANDDIGWLQCGEKGLEDPTQASSWILWDSGERKWSKLGQTSVSVIDPTAPRRVRVSGASGENTTVVNGIYNPTGEMYNGRPLFQKQGDGDKWLRYVTSKGMNDWRVSSTSHKDANDEIGWLQCGEKSLDDPTQATSWKVYHSKDKRWDLQKDLYVTVI